MKRWFAFVGVMVCLTCIGCGSSTAAPSPPPANITLTFNGLTVNQAPVSLYSESGFTVSSDARDWFVVTTYGHPAPFIEFRAVGDTGLGQVQVFADRHGPFTFKSVDLYSSTTPIPYTITGVRGVAVVYTVTDTLPNTFGNFRTVVNPHATDVIDTLTISLSNPTAPNPTNPTGLDNVVVGP
jgi:hypothetical protein